MGQMCFDSPEPLVETGLAKHGFPPCGCGSSHTPQYAARREVISSHFQKTSPCKGPSPAITSWTPHARGNLMDDVCTAAITSCHAHTRNTPIRCDVGDSTTVPWRNSTRVEQKSYALGTARTA